MPPETCKTPRAIYWGAGLFSAAVFLVSWWHWWSFQYGTFDLAFYVQAMWLAIRGKWTVSLLGVPLMGNHAEPIVFLLAPLFAVCPHPMLFVAVQTLAFATMPFTAWRIARRLGFEKAPAICLALATVLTPATASIGIYEFHPEAFAAPLILLLIEARLGERRGPFWLWFIAVLAVKENLALLLIAFCGVWALPDWKRGREWLWRWDLVPLGIAAAWLVICGKVISPWLNAGNVDYLQLYGHLGKSGGDILLKFFTEPHRFLGALHVALTKGNMVWTLLFPFLALPLLRPRWLLIAAPLLLQHLLSWRYTEWSLGAHYPAPFIPLFWIAAVEAISRLPRRGVIAAGIACACAASHIWLGPAREIAAEIPHVAQIFEDREVKAAMLRGIPDDASVTASLPFLPHLAKRERLISLHHILKGLKTLSGKTYTPPAATDVVFIDYADTATFSTAAGYYHPKMRTEAAQVIPSSDRLLHEFLRGHSWNREARNAVCLMRREKPQALPPLPATPREITPGSSLDAFFISNRTPAAVEFRLDWRFTGEREVFPWMMLVLMNREHRYALPAWMCAPAETESAQETWTQIFPLWVEPGTYAVTGMFFDNNRASASKHWPPDDVKTVLGAVDFGSWEVKPAGSE